MTNSAKNVALLAPVPLEHLVDGAKVVQNEGRVAFGSRVWEVFRDLDALRHGLPVDVYIYASHTTPPAPLEVSWVGRYVGHVESDGGADPDGIRFRPASTLKYSNDNDGHWAIFWELEGLDEWPRMKRLKMTDFTGYGKPKRYPKPFVPEGPILVEHP